jgi:inosine/xanthosine triphosphatase
MRRVIVGSKNPVKLSATKEAFETAFPNVAFEFTAFEVPSGVPDQPFGDDETRLGATNRASACKAEHPNADYFVGLEGGLLDTKEEIWSFAWMCVMDKDGQTGYGKAASFLLPEKICALIRGGKELGHATDAVFSQTNSKHGESTIGILTHSAITRTDFYREAMIFALIPFMNPELYSKHRNKNMVDEIQV